MGVFLLYDLGDVKAHVCEIWCFYHILNTMVDFWTLAQCTTRSMQTTTTDEAIHRRMHDYPVYEINPGNFVFYK